MKNSVAIWVDETNTEADVHINYWIIKRKLIPRDHFIDVGVKLCKWSGGIVYFYFPTEITKESLSDLGRELINKELANALFNENCQIISGDGKKFEISLPDEQLTVFQCDIKNDVKFEHKYDGTVISINVPRHEKNWYLRFRIRIELLDALKKLILSRRWQTVRSIFSEKHTPKGSFYQSVRSSVDAIDFRINNKRDLNVSLLDEQQTNFLQLRNLHFLLINDIDEDLASSSIKPRYTRLLEAEIWKRYLHDIPGNARKYRAIHWKCTPEHENGWDVFIKLQFGSANVITITWYILLLSFMAITLNVIACFIYDKTKLDLNSLYNVFNDSLK